MAYRLEFNENLIEGTRRLLLERVNAIHANLTTPEIDRDEGVHEARKNCKRTRSAYRLIRDEIGQSIYHQENRRFRDIARRLAGARDSWVMLQTLERLIQEHPEQLSDRAYETIRDKLMKQYQELLLLEKEDQNKIPSIIENLQQASAQIEKLPIEHPDFSAFREGIYRVYARGRRAFQIAYRQPTPEIFHEWRKRVKYLWHNIEILELIQPEELLGVADQLHTLSDLLGTDHDLILLRISVLGQQPEFGGDPGLRNFGTLIDQERQILQKTAYPIGEQLYQDPPECFVQRLETYWEGWQPPIGSCLDDANPNASNR